MHGPTYSPVCCQGRLRLSSRTAASTYRHLSSSFVCSGAARACNVCSSTRATPRSWAWQSYRRCHTSEYVARVCAHHRARTRAHASLPCCLAQVICWDSALHDSAARAFSRGFYKAIGNDARARISSAVNAAHVAFKAGGFKVRRVAYPRRGTDVAVQRAHRGWGVRLVTAQRGRPEIYWHPPNHYHRELIAQHKKVPSTCLGCFPPCHGMPVLLVAQREDA